MTAFDNIKTNNWPATSSTDEDFTIAKVYWDEPNFYLPTKVGSATLCDNPLTATGGVSADPNNASTNSLNVKRFATIYGSTPYSSHYVSFPAGFQLPGRSDWTIDLYLKKATSGGGDWSAPFGNWASNGSNAQVSLGINGRSTATWDFYFGIDGGTFQQAAQSTQWDATAWTHYRFEYVHSTRAFRAWSNGTLTGSATVSSPGFKHGSGVNTMDIGHQGGGDNAIQGEFGPMRIVSKALGAPPSGGLVLNSRGRFNND